MNKEAIHTEKAPAAVGPYSQAISAGSLVALSGQIPLDPATGKLVEGDIKEQTRRVFANIKAVLEEGGMTFANVIKTTVFLADIADFADMNEVYAEYFEEPYPARSAVQIAALPKGAGLEIECLCVK
jgi:2-iminobutanoate/2-iminopropanoate deaminase